MRDTMTPQSDTGGDAALVCLLLGDARVVGLRRVGRAQPGGPRDLGGADGQADDARGGGVPLVEVPEGFGVADRIGRGASVFPAVGDIGVHGAGGRREEAQVSATNGFGLYQGCFPRAVEELGNLPGNNVPR